MSVLPCVGGKTAELGLGFEDLAHMGGRLTVADQSDTDRHAVGSGQSVVGRGWSVADAAVFHLVVRWRAMPAGLSVRSHGAA